MKKTGVTQQPIDKSRKFVTVKLSTKITDILERICLVENITRSYLISNILEDYIQNYDLKLLEHKEYIKETLKF
jgi:predicted transcriptional regulator